MTDTAAIRTEEQQLNDAAGTSGLTAEQVLTLAAGGGVGIFANTIVVPPSDNPQAVQAAIDKAAARTGYDPDAAAPVATLPIDGDNAVDGDTATVRVTTLLGEYIYAFYTYNSSSAALSMSRGWLDSAANGNLSYAALDHADLVTVAYADGVYTFTAKDKTSVSEIVVTAPVTWTASTATSSNAQPLVVPQTLELPTGKFVIPPQTTIQQKPYVYVVGQGKRATRIVADVSDPFIPPPFTLYLNNFPWQMQSHTRMRGLSIENPLDYNVTDCGGCILWHGAVSDVTVEDCRLASPSWGILALSEDPLAELDDAVIVRNECDCSNPFYITTAGQRLICRNNYGTCRARSTQCHALWDSLPANDGGKRQRRFIVEDNTFLIERRHSTPGNEYLWNIGGYENTVRNNVIIDIIDMERRNLSGELINCISIGPSDIAPREVDRPNLFENNTARFVFINYTGTHLGSITGIKGDDFASGSAVELRNNKVDCNVPATIVTPIITPAGQEMILHPDGLCGIFDLRTISPSDAAGTNTIMAPMVSSCSAVATLGKADITAAFGEPGILGAGFAAYGIVAGETGARVFSTDGTDWYYSAQGTKAS